MINRLTKKAGIGFRVTPLSLAFSMRAIALEKGFSYVGVVRAAGDLETRRLAKWVERAPNSIKDHAALRMARLVIGAPNESTYQLMQARVLLQESDSPPSVAAAYAGAVLERHLRILVEDLGLQVKTNNPKLGTYSSVLSAHGTLSPSEVQLIAHIQGHRDYAAHGWFERISHRDAEWVIDESQNLVGRLPIWQANTAPPGRKP